MKHRGKEPQRQGDRVGRKGRGRRKKTEREEAEGEGHREEKAR
jgi:hypothetical protein